MAITRSRISRRAANYTVTPSAANFTFTPPAASFENLRANQAANFTATLITADVSITVTDTPDPVTAGANLTYSLTVANAGTSAANNVRVMSSIPSGVEVVSFNGGDGAECGATGTSLVCSLGNLSAAASRVVTLVVRPQQAGTLNLTASVTSDTSDPNTANNTATQSTTVAAATLTVSGRVADAGNNGIGGITVTLSGSQSATTTTDQSGNYSFANLAVGGSYTVTPTRTDFVFAPLNRTFTNLRANATADFSGALVNLSIGGRITDLNGNPLPGVNVTLSGVGSATVATNANGEYLSPQLHRALTTP
jgi:uncharacterized repeat protein (TIGR01451 family)